MQSQDWRWLRPRDLRQSTVSTCISISFLFEMTNEVKQIPRNRLLHVKLVIQELSRLQILFLKVSISPLSFQHLYFLKQHRYLQID